MTNYEITSETFVLPSSSILTAAIVYLLIFSFLFHSKITATASTFSSSSVRCPSMCRCLEKGSVTTCHGSDLAHIPYVPETTLILDLDHNHISLIQNGTLHRTVRLEILSLQDNGILHLEGGVFDALHELRVLRLGRNHLSSLPRNIFSGNQKLQSLDLHANYFATIPDDVMYHLHSLQVLNMSFNHLTSPDLGPGFRFTTQLSVLDMSGNDFSSIESSSFEVMQLWDEKVSLHFNLSYSNIRHVHPQSFHQIQRPVSLSVEGNLHVQQPVLQAALRDMRLSTLKVVNFSHMNITDLISFVQEFRPSGLVQLELAYNRVKSVPKGTFFFFVNLRHLDISHNDITVVENLAGLSKLEYLNLGYNNIDVLNEMMFEGLHELKFLDVSHNSITRIDEDPFLNLFNLHTIDVSSNQIYQFHINDGLESLEVLNAGWNRVSNLRFLQRLRRLNSFDLSYNMITRLGDEIFSRGQRISFANFSNNAIFDVSPTAFQGGIYEVLDLSHNRLTSVMYHGWESIKTLYLHSNSIHNITVNSFRNLRSLRELRLQRNNLYTLPKEMFLNLHLLTVLDLSFNPIGSFLEIPEVVTTIGRLEKLETLKLEKIGLTDVSKKLLRNLAMLRTLDLSHNQLNELDYDLIPLLFRLTRLDLSHNGLRQIDPAILSKTSKLKYLDLSSNPFDCTCALVPFCRLLFSGEMTIVSVNNRTLYQCVTPDEWTGISLTAFHTDSQQCSYFEKAVLCAIVGSAAVAVMLIVTVTVCRYKTWRKHKSKHLINYKFVDETSLTSSSNSSSNNGAVTAAGASSSTTTSAPTTSLLSKQWV